VLAAILAKINTLTSTDVSAIAIAAAVRTNLATELARIDTAISTRLATAGYTSPPSASTIADAVAVQSAVATALTTISNNLNAKVGDVKDLINVNLVATGAVGTVTSQTHMVISLDGTIGAGDFDGTINGAEIVFYDSDSSHFCRRTILTSVNSGGNVDVTIDRAPSFTVVETYPVAILSMSFGKSDRDTLDAITGGSTAEEIAGAVRTELGLELSRIDVSMSSRCAQSTGDEINSGISNLEATLDAETAQDLAEVFAGGATELGYFQTFCSNNSADKTIHDLTTPKNQSMTLKNQSFTLY
jgi:hypothetical protein